ncbi:hypothetical protein M0802_003366 [Mischocyttarus mexicanus]|nr:hypothetical protein M0802_003366 [Mischocyttarus mexicanus]
MEKDEEDEKKKKNEKRRRRRRRRRRKGRLLPMPPSPHSLSPPPLPCPIFPAVVSTPWQEEEEEDRGTPPLEGRRGALCVSKNGALIGGSVAVMRYQPVQNKGINVKKRVLVGWYVASYGGGGGGGGAVAAVADTEEG